MNRERVAKLRDHMILLADRGENQRFNWNHWARAPNGDYATPHRVENDCGTSACVAGWAVTLFSSYRHLTSGWKEEAVQVLGITRNMANELFFPSPTCAPGLHPSWANHTSQVPPRGVAMVLDHLLLTGEVDWGVMGPRICYDENGREVKR